MNDTVRIIEIFSSIQGEGIYVGKAHLFIRFWDCNLSCAYCDTDYRGPYRQVSGDQLLQEVQTYVEREGSFHAVSLTGGEPLLWWKFLKGWLPRLKGFGQRTYLETNGTLPQALSELLPWIDIVAMDIKPPSATADRAVWREHEAFLRMAHQGLPEVFVKIVVTGGTCDQEIQQALDLVASVGEGIPVVLQPVTPFREVHESVSEEQLGRWLKAARRKLSDVRIIPQVHRLLGVP